MDSLVSQSANPLNVVGAYRERIFRTFGVQVSIHPFAPTMSDWLIKANKTEESIALLKQEVNKDPTDIDLFARLFVQLKMNKKADFTDYKTKLLGIFEQLKTSKVEQGEWLDWIDKNSR